MPKIWLNRPLADSKLLAQELSEHGIDSIIAPVIEISPCAFSAPVTKPDALLVSSRHACPALAQLPAEWRKLPVYCVGDATASLVRELNFDQVIPSGQDMLSLLPHIMQNASTHRNVLYLSGEDVSLDITARLAENSIHVTRLIVYKAHAVAALPDALMRAIKAKEITATAFFSKRSALIANQRILEAGLGAFTPSIVACCISLNVAEQAGVLPWARLLTCHAHNRHAMRDLIVSLTKNP